jgi:hypothetical protein
MGVPAPAYATGWAAIFFEGEPASRGVYFVNLDSVATIYSPEAQQAIATAGPNANTAELSKLLASNEMKTMEVVHVSQKAGAPLWTKMTLEFQCANRQVRLSQTVKGISDSQSETTTSDRWFSVLLSWVWFEKLILRGLRPGKINFSNRFSVM